MVKKKRIYIGHLTQKFQTALRFFQGLLLFTNMLLKALMGMFTGFSGRQIKACAALLLLDGELS